MALTSTDIHQLPLGQRLRELEARLNFLGANGKLDSKEEAIILLTRDEMKSIATAVSFSRDPKTINTYREIIEGHPIHDAVCRYNL
jgi:hypothetical protein